MRSMGRSEGSGWGIWLLILVVILVLAGMIAMTVYGGMVSPQQHEVEQVIPNDRFPG
jgi:flagellar basal body-associated protein FliL